MSAASAIEIFVNDRATSAVEGTSLQALLAGLGLEGKKGVAAALNGTVVPRSAWAAQTLASGDKVLVIQATQGG